jgi:hypothetical protein
VEPDPPLKVDVELRSLRELPQWNGPKPAEVMPGLKRRVTVTRALLVVAGSALIAFGAQRLGIPVGAGLCLFFVALPALWVGGFLIGTLFTVRKVAREMPGQPIRLDFSTSNQVVEKVTLEVGELGLNVTRRPEAQAESTQLIGWNRVQLGRHHPEQASIFTADGLHFDVPATAFPSRETFDAFCVAVQGKIWAAQK